jgi:hypothetical protein
MLTTLAQLLATGASAVVSPALFLMFVIWVGGLFRPGYEVWLILWSAIMVASFLVSWYNKWARLRDLPVIKDEDDKENTP